MNASNSHYEDLLIKYVFKKLLKFRNFYIIEVTITDISRKVIPSYRNIVYE